MTNRELASFFNISPAAFSLIINHKQGVSATTRDRVLNELRNMGYSYLIKELPDDSKNSQTVSSSIATSSMGNDTSSKNLCFVIFKCDGSILDTHPFFLLLIEYLEKRAQRYGYNMLISTVDKRADYISQLNRLNLIDADALIIFATEMRNEDLAFLNVLQKPYLMLDNAFDFNPLNAVAIDNEMGTFQAIEHLVKQGHRRIGYLAASNRISSFQERENGYIKALQSFNLELAGNDRYELSFTEEGSYHDFIKILETTTDLPDAFVSDDDTIAAGVLRALHEKGYSIPEDISLIGYNDRPVCSLLSPALTTVSVSKYSFAVEAVDSIIKILQNLNDGVDYRTKKIRTATGLTIRSSVKFIERFK